MNKYPVWKYTLILIALLAGLVYASPNIFGEDPAIQISGSRDSVVSASLLADVEGLLKRKKLDYKTALQVGDNIEIRFADADVQLKARDIVQRELGQKYTVALNLLPTI